MDTREIVAREAGNVLHDWTVMVAICWAVVAVLGAFKLGRKLGR